MKKKIRFVINPHSGTSKGDKVPLLIRNVIDETFYDVEVVYTEYAGHGEKIAADAVKENYHAVISVGGDGSIQEIARATIGTNTLLGIIPKGSGNGLARHLAIPMQTEDALQVVNRNNFKTIDVMKVDDRLCVNVFGIGFDAHIANLFSKSPKRGYATYVKLVLSEFNKFQPLNLEVTADSKAMEMKSFLLTLANGSQFGNNAMIAPEADICDGKMDICSLKKFPFYIAPSLIYLLMKNKINCSKYYSMFRSKEMTITSTNNIVAHLDGEPVEFGKTIHAVIQPKVLKIIVP